MAFTVSFSPGLPSHPQLIRSHSALKLTSIPVCDGETPLPEVAVAKSTEHVLRMRRLVLVMVGLPARGKSYITHKLKRYLNWMGFNVRYLAVFRCGSVSNCRRSQTRVFNAGDTRRKKLGAGQDNTFFDSSNTSSHNLRDVIAMETLDELLDWLSADGT
jgi:6-phosphofructo-2-kinase